MSSSDFRNQVAVVTGASSGLGKSIAAALQAAGALVARVDLLEHQEDNKNFYRCDITHETQVAETVSKIFKDHGRIDILVNSAGITGATAIKSHETSISDVKKVFEVNFFGSYLFSKYVIPVMLSKNYGRILHIASIAGKEGNSGMLAYSSSKAAVIGMTKVQGKEYAETGITINAIAPAVIRTPLVDAMPEEQVRYMTDKIPMKRCGTLEEVASAALFIISPKNSFSTGFTFDLSGGRATY